MDQNKEKKGGKRNRTTYRTRHPCNPFQMHTHIEENIHLFIHSWFSFNRFTFIYLFTFTHKHIHTHTYVGVCASVGILLLLITLHLCEF